MADNNFPHPLFPICLFVKIRNWFCSGWGLMALFYCFFKTLILKVLATRLNTVSPSNIRIVYITCANNLAKLSESFFTATILLGVNDILKRQYYWNTSLELGSTAIASVKLLVHQRTE